MYFGSGACTTWVETPPCLLFLILTFRIVQFSESTSCVRRIRLVAKFCMAGKRHSELSGRPVKALFDPCLFVTIEAFVMLKTHLRFGYVLVFSALLKSNLMDDLQLLNKWKTIGCLVALLSEVAGITEYFSCPSSVRNIL